MCTSREVNEARWPHTCSRPCAFEEKKTAKKIAKKSRPAENKPRKPQQPGDRDHLETACDETRHTRSPTLARFYRSRVCGNRPRTALAISKNDECYTHIHTTTDRQIKNGTLFAPRYEEVFLPKGKKRPWLLCSLGLASLKKVKIGQAMVRRFCRKFCFLHFLF